MVAKDLEAGQSYIYCLTSRSHVGVCIVGNTPDVPTRLVDKLNAFDQPYPFVLEFAKQVVDGPLSETTIHTLLELIGKRYGSSRTYFIVPFEKVRPIFEQVAGEWLEIKESITATDVNLRMPITRDDMAEYFTHGQRIRHIGSIGDMWIAHFSRGMMQLVHDHITYATLSEFSAAHYEAVTGNGGPTNGWAECEYEIQPGRWVSVENIDR